MDGTNMKRIVILGKTGFGRSSLGNTIFGETVFKMGHFSKSETTSCQAESRCVNGRSITLIDTPGFFDTEKSEEQLKEAILRCFTECAPGPHVFLIVLKVTYTNQEDIITKLCQYFSEEAFRYAAVVFTHGDQLPEGMEIQEFVSQSEGLSDLVKKCGGRCHVVDNKYWKNEQQNQYRSNQVQVAELLNTIDKIVKDNNGGFYTNEMLQAVEREIQKEMEKITESSGNLSGEEIREKAKIRAPLSYLMKLFDSLWLKFTKVKETVCKVVGGAGGTGEVEVAQEEKSGAVGGTGVSVTTEYESGGVEEAETAGEAAEDSRSEAEPASCQESDNVILKQVMPKTK